MTVGSLLHSCINIIEIEYIGVAHGKKGIQINQYKILFLLLSISNFFSYFFSLSILSILFGNLPQYIWLPEIYSFGMIVLYLHLMLWDLLIVHKEIGT